MEDIVFGTKEGLMFTFINIIQFGQFIFDVCIFHYSFVFRVQKFIVGVDLAHL